MWHNINFKLIGRIIGTMLLLLGVQMLLPAIVSLIYKDIHTALIFLFSSVVVCVFGGALRLTVGWEVKFLLHRKEGFLIVGLVWILASLAGSIPFVLSGVLPRFTDAFFESMSGFSTTGASVITDLSATPKGIIFWRSLTQWIGGGGLILMTISILRNLRENVQHMFVAEHPGPIKIKVHPKMRETVRRFWYVYIGLSTLLFIFLMFGDMSTFEAICHTLSTVSTGGFSTRPDSILSFSNYTRYVITVFMFLAGINFGLLYFLFWRQPKKMWYNEEFRWYLRLIFIFSILALIVLRLFAKFPIGEAFQHAVFGVISTISTTGYIIHSSYLPLAPILAVGLFMMMIIGGCSGSSAGGIKVSRLILLTKFLFAQFKKQLHPNAIFPIKNNGAIISPEIIRTIFAFFFLYVLFFTGGAFVLTLTGESIRNAMSMSVSAIGSIGPIASELCIDCSFAHLHDLSKWTLSFLMMAGRLELLAVVALFSPSFWKS